MSEETTLNAELNFDSDAYDLIEPIGRGGFGQVYKARNKNTDQFVAIKFLTLNSDFDLDKKTRYIKRFEREAMLCSRLQHPNIVRLLDKGQCEGDLLYAVFEYVDGLTLKDLLLESGALSALESAEIMIQILDALGHAHDNGVIHRDIKPANIMMTRDGAKLHVKILDFGIASLSEETRQAEYKTLTLTRETLGTPSYSAPEQLRGEPVSPKTDLYVWGLVFIECLTGQPAVSGSSLASVFYKQLSQSNVPLPAAIAGHPVALLLRRVLQKKVHDRNVTAAGLYKDMAAINFSSLVGCVVGFEPQDTTFARIVGCDETLVSESSQLYTGLTERKQITALSICLNIRSIAEGEIDHELVDALHRDQKNQCIDTAIRYGGFHVGTLGDTLLFYFGYPVATDNDLRLCARTALELVSGLNKRYELLKTHQGVTLDMHIGMHTGLVTCYADATPEGDTPNIAMQLSRMSSEGRVFCSDSSRKMLESYIEFEPAKFNVRGIEGVAIPVFNLMGERELEAFGFLRGTNSNNAFVGREEELKQLSALLPPDLTKPGNLLGKTFGRSLSNTREGDELESKNTKPNLAHIHGEAGIGKSRLMFELRNKAQYMRHYVAQCLPEHQNNALYPILNVLRLQYSLDALEPGEAREHLSQVISELSFNGFESDIRENVKGQGLAILCAWLGLPLGDNLQPSGLAPDLQKTILFTTLGVLLTSPLRNIHGENRDREEQENHESHLFIFEDMHWADPTSLEFIEQFVQMAALGEGDVFISTSRQELPESLSALNINVIAVKKLTDESTAKFIVALFDKATVSPQVLDVVVGRTDGIPLFIEELVNMLQQKKLVHKLNGIIEFVSPDKLAEVPSSLRDSLQQKLDSLVSSKEMAQLAATIGREFDYDLLVSASTYNERQVQLSLDELVNAEIVFQQRKVDGDSYVFKHALVRDAAYSGLSGENKKDNHKRVADAIAEMFEDDSDRVSRDIARHFADGDCYFEAVQYGLIDARYSQSRSANKETILIGEQVMAWVSCLSNAEDKNKADIEINSVMFSAVMAIYGYGSNELVEISRRLKDLIDEYELNRYSSKDIDLILADVKFLSDWVLFVDHQFRSRCKEAIELAENIILNARKNKNRVHELLILPLLGQTYHLAGDMDKGKACCERVLQLYDDSTDLELWKIYGIEVKSQALFLLSHILLCQGKVDQAYSVSEKALQWALEAGATMFVDASYLFATLLAYLSHDSERGLEIESEHRLYHKGELSPQSWLVAYSMTGYDWANNRTEHHENFIKHLLDDGRSGALCWWEGMLADTYLTLGEWNKAIQKMEEAISRCVNTGEAAALPLLQRVLAVAKTKKYGKITKDIITIFHDASDSAVKQQADWLLLDVLYHFYCMLLDHGDDYMKETKSCCDRLTLLLDKLDEGRDTPLYKKSVEIIKLNS